MCAVKGVACPKKRPYVSIELTGTFYQQTNREVSMKKLVKSLIVSVLCGSAFVGIQANASLRQITMSFDNDAASWGVYTHLNGDGYVSTDASNARSGTKSGFVYSFSG